jgi:cell division protein FtsL
MTRSYSSLMFWLCMTIMASLMLYHTSDRVTELDRDLRALNAQIADEQESLHVLKAEWVYLANPARIQAEAARHLALQPTSPNRVTALQNIALLLPVHNGAEPVYADASPGKPSLAGALDAKQDMSGVASAKPENRFKHVAANAIHINEHMNLTHSAAAVPADRIGAMLGTLGSLHP